MIGQILNGFYIDVNSSNTIRLNMVCVAKVDLVTSYIILCTDVSSIQVQFDSNEIAKAELLEIMNSM
jgi:hypothetical protein